MRKVQQVGLLIVFLLIVGCASRTAVIPVGPVLADFDRLVKAYAALRGSMEEGKAELDETKKAEEISTAEAILAAKIQAARRNAKRGDIFTPAIEKRFRALLNPEMKGVRGQNTRGIIFDEGPGQFAFKVNGSYPKDKPLGSVPSNILAILPPLPEDIEYRFIDKHLILRDARANLIIDYIPRAIG